MSERLFYCGVSPPERESRRATELWLTEGSRNITRDIDGITDRMVAEVPPLLRDLLDIATYVFIADRATGRGGDTLPNMGSDWRRNFRFVIAVRQPVRWNSPTVKEKLEELVGFVSEDNYQFKFVQADDPPPFPTRLPLKPDQRMPARQDQVLLFSGGLDSLAGALDELNTTEDRVVLVSHRSSNRIFNRQRSLAKSLANSFPDRVLHAPVEVTMVSGSGLRDNEETQRTRTFLFSALGFVFAEMLGCNQIRFFENGIMSFNLPFAAQVVGSRASRSTHPLALRLMEEFATNALQHRVGVTNPYIWLTKAEVLKRIAEHGKTKLIGSTISCTHVRKTGSKSHCGKCSQCIQRRLGILAAGLTDSEDVNNYEIELLTGDRLEGKARAMATSLVGTALDYPRRNLEGFMSAFGGEVLRAGRGFKELTIDEAVRRTFDLHQRFGLEVRHVIDNEIRYHAPEIREHTLPPGCLLRAVLADDRATLEQAILDDSLPTERSAQPTTAEVAPNYAHPLEYALTFLDLEQRVFIEGLGIVGTATDYALLNCLAELYRKSREDELKMENYPFTSAEALTDELGLPSVETLRQEISETRKRIAAIALDRWGIPINKDAVIQGRHGVGYRLNPKVRLIAEGELT